jgi:hypothetical protein
MQRPNEEKRMVVILDPAEHGEWLSCSVADAPKFFVSGPGQLDAFPAPLPRRPPSASRVRTARPPQQGEGGANSGWL